MQRNTPQTPRNPRSGAERDATQAMGGQPRDEDDEEGLQEPEKAPSFLSARELQAPEPKPQADTPAKGRIVRPGGNEEDEA